MSTLVYFSKAIGFEICFNILCKSTIKDNLERFTTIHVVVLQLEIRESQDLA